MNQKLEAFRERIRTHSGFCAHYAFQQNYDKDEKTGQHHNIGDGGVRLDGPHAEITDFLDKPQPRYKLVLAPRGTMKSTIALFGRCGRAILANPNIRILYGMHDETLIREKSKGLRTALRSARVTEMFGQQLDDVSDVEAWTVITRTQIGLQEATFTTFTTATPPDGGHYDIIVCDDLINDKWCSVEKMEQARKVMRGIFPLLDKGALLIVIGTRWSDDDIYNEILNNPEFDKLVLNSGEDVEIVSDEKGIPRLIGTPRFPNTSIGYLNEALSHMKPRQFMAQYMNVIANDLRDRFTRDMFQPIAWGEDMEGLSAYLLTDTAGSMEKGSDYSVIAVVGLDQTHSVYLLDLQVGHWFLDEFIQRFFDLREHWAQKVNVVGETMEVSQAGYYAMNALQKEAALRQVKINLIKLTRGSGSRKKQRIDAMEPVMRKRKFFVVSTVPRTFADTGAEKVLWNSTKEWNAKDKIAEPGGELVDQFVKHPLYPYDDIADAIADIEAIDKSKGTRFCTWKVPKPKGRPRWSLAEDRNSAIVEAMAAFPNTGQQDFFADLAKKNGIVA